MGLERDQRHRVQRRGFRPYGAVIVSLCAVLGCLTVLQCRVWRSNLTLWTATNAVQPSARAAINLGVAYRKAGEPDRAAYWFSVAGPLTRGETREAEYRRILALELGMLETFGTFVCDQPSLRPYC